MNNKELIDYLQHVLRPSSNRTNGKLNETAYEVFVRIVNCREHKPLIRAHLPGGLGPYTEHFGMRRGVSSNETTAWLVPHKLVRDKLD